MILFGFRMWPEMTPLKKYAQAPWTEPIVQQISKIPGSLALMWIQCCLIVSPDRDLVLRSWSQRVTSSWGPRPHWCTQAGGTAQPSCRTSRWVYGYNDWVLFLVCSIKQWMYCDNKWVSSAFHYMVVWFFFHSRYIILHSFPYLELVARWLRHLTWHLGILGSIPVVLVICKSLRQVLDPPPQSTQQ